METKTIVVEGVNWGTVTGRLQDNPAAMVAVNVSDEEAQRLIEKLINHRPGPGASPPTLEVPVDKIKSVNFDSD